MKPLNKFITVWLKFCTFSIFYFRNKYVYTDERHKIQRFKTRLAVRQWSGFVKSVNGSTTWCSTAHACCAHVIIGHAQFWIASSLGLTWPYRWLFRSLSSKESHIIKKTFSKPDSTNSTLSVRVDPLDNVRDFLCDESFSLDDSVSEGSFVLSDISLNDLDNSSVHM